MSLSTPRRFRISRYVLQAIAGFCAVILVLGGVGLITPSLAQQESTAPIMIEGRTLFKINASGDFTAQQRANYVNNQLQKILDETAQPILLEVDTTEKIPVIRVENTYLLSVTSNDVIGDRTLEDQANDWKNTLENAIRRAEYERTPNYLLKAISISLGILFLAGILTWRLGIFWQNWLKSLKEKNASLDSSISSPTLSPFSTPSSQSSYSLLLGCLSLLSIVIRGIIWLFILFYISRLFSQTRELSQSLFKIIRVSLVANIFPLGDKSYSVIDFLILIGLFVVLFVLTRMVSEILKSRLLSATGLSRSVQDTTALITNYTLIFLGTIVVLQVWGLDLSSLTVFASVLGVGIGLGLQGIAKEFISGLVLIFERPIQVGDFVEVSGLMGTVERISVRSTEIRTLDQISVILPNSRFLESEVINWSHYSPISRLKLPIGVAYGSDLEVVKQSLIEVAKSHKEVLSMPSPQVFFQEFGDSSLNFYLLVWISKPYKQFQIKSDLYFQIDAIFREKAIAIPFPQRDLHIRTGDLSSPTISPELIQSLTNLSHSLANWLDSQSDHPNSRH